jgi:large subunit ribosomal protein L2
MYHKGGVLKRMYRLILHSFFTLKREFVIIHSIEKDPNRSSFIGLAQNRAGYFFNILVSSNTKVGDVFFINKGLVKNLAVGDVVKLRHASKGMPLYNLEKYPGSGSVYSKTAGTHSFLLAKYLKYAKIKLPSGEERLFDLDCLATVGMPSNSFSFLNKKYKAGTNRLLNRRPVVRGTAKNPIDHPHGGGAGKTAPGRPSVSP